MPIFSHIISAILCPRVSPLIAIRHPISLWIIQQNTPVSTLEVFLPMGTLRLDCLRQKSSPAFKPSNRNCLADPLPMSLAVRRRLYVPMVQVIILNLLLYALLTDSVIIFLRVILLARALFGIIPLVRMILLIAPHIRAWT